MGDSVGNSTLIFSELHGIPEVIWHNGLSGFLKVKISYLDL